MPLTLVKSSLYLDLLDHYIEVGLVNDAYALCVKLRTLLGEQI